LAGPLDRAKLNSLIRKQPVSCIVDATHPYATQISLLAMECAAECGIEYCRYERGSAGPATSPGLDSAPGADSLTQKGSVYWARDLADAAGQSAQLGDNIFLTIGSKGLGEFCANISRDQVRLTARVLPDAKVLEQCTGLGFTPRELIAMQGPFSYELNQAMFKAVAANVLVTKESGQVGGVDTKVAAALDLGMAVVIIARPAITYRNQMNSFAQIYEFCTRL
ncbi:MAG TPA: precorrin-6A reductase, partial [Bacillota bacterium]|nr:precorrin-6A reductase [Bacillota bacterium]